MSELTLDHDQWDPLVRHLHRVGVSQPMRREPAPHPGSGGHVM